MKGLCHICYATNVTIAFDQDTGENTCMKCMVKT